MYHFMSSLLGYHKPPDHIYFDNNNYFWRGFDKRGKRWGIVLYVGSKYFDPYCPNSTLIANTDSTICRIRLDTLAFNDDWRTITKDENTKKNVVKKMIDLVTIV